MMRLARSFAAPLAALALAGCFGGAKVPPVLLTLSPETAAPAEISRAANAGDAVTIEVPIVPKELKSVRVPAQVGATVGRLHRGPPMGRHARQTVPAICCPKRSRGRPDASCSTRTSRRSILACMSPAHCSGSAMTLPRAMPSSSTMARCRPRAAPASKPAVSRPASPPTAPPRRSVRRSNRAANQVAIEVAKWIGG